MCYFVLVKICEPLDEAQAEPEATGPLLMTGWSIEYSFGKMSHSLVIEGIASINEIMCTNCGRIVQRYLRMSSSFDDFDLSRTCFAINSIFFRSLR